MKNQEKQIEEMTKVIARRSNSFRNPKVAFMTTAEKTAESLYIAGYRKQSEWVSVEDRLPEREGIYLIYTISGHIRLGEFRPYFMGDEPQFDPYTTHWMPLPEPPKGE